MLINVRVGTAPKVQRLLLGSVSKYTLPAGISWVSRDIPFCYFFLLFSVWIHVSRLINEQSWWLNVTTITKCHASCTGLISPQRIARCHWLGLPLVSPRCPPRRVQARTWRHRNINNIWLSLTRLLGDWRSGH